MHDEPVIIDIGFKSNRRGGWWFREPSNAYTLQIVPSGLPLEHVRVATNIVIFLIPQMDRLPLEHVRVATPQQFQSMLEFETCERVDFVVNVRCCKNSVRLTTIVEMLNMLFTAFAVRGCMG